MNRKLSLLLFVALSVFSFALAKAKSDPYIEDPNQEWGDLSNPASIWSPDAAAVHAGRLGAADDVDAFTVDFSNTKTKFQFQMFVPVCGQHFQDFRPSVAVIGPGLGTPPDGMLPFALPDGMGAQVFPDDHSINGTRIVIPSNTVTGDQPVYASDVQSVSIPQTGEYLVAVWEPHGNVGAYMLSTGWGGDEFADRPQSEIEAAFNQLFSGEWMHQDCNAPLTTVTCPSAGDTGAPSSAASEASNRFTLTGVVRDTADCQPIPNAQIAYWLLGKTGVPEDDQTGKLFTNEAGVYQIEGNRPDSDIGSNRIILAVSAPGYQPLITDYIVHTDDSSPMTLDLTIEPESKAP